MTGGGDRRDAVGAGERGLQLRDLAISHLLAVDGEQQRGVGAGAERFGDQVVRLPDRGVLGLVPRVAGADLHAQRRSGERQQHDGGTDQPHDRAAADRTRQPGAGRRV
jgi:hypothetical protein